MKLDVLGLKDCQQVRLWRNECLETLRTPYPLTADQQTEFYQKVINNPKSPHRYWGICLDETDQSERFSADFLITCQSLVGMGGLTFIEWENRQAEISLILDPKQRGEGYGKEAVHLLLDQAFNYLNLELVYGECYLVPDGAEDFWRNILDAMQIIPAKLRKGKFWNGKHCDTMYFDISKEDFNKEKYEVE